jgi:hypothetical protein
MLSYTVPATTAAEVTTYLSAAGVTGWPEAEVDQSAAVMRGQRYVAATYNARWTTDFTNDAAPDVVKHAIAEAALVEAKTAGALTAALPDKVLTGAGKLSWTLADRRFDHNSAVPPIIGQLLVDLVSANSSENGWAWAAAVDEQESDG